MIKYEKTTWVDGETVIKAEHMKKIEQGIVDLCSEIDNITSETTDLSNYYTKSETYNKTEIDSKIANMGTGGSVDLSNYYTKSETDKAMNGKANKVHTHNEYLTELPTHTHSEYLTELPSHEHEQYLTEHQDISHKADKENTYTKNQTDNKISEEIAKAQLGGSGEVDLSAYATKNYVNEEIAKIEVGDKHTHSNLSVLDNITQTKVNEWNSKANASHTHSDYANKTHAHNEYALSNHTHNYASTSHTHSDYANKTHNHSTSDISNLGSYVSSLITDDVYINSLKSTIDTLSSELAKVKIDIEALKNNSGSANIPVTDITCSDWDVSLQVGQTKQITASVVPSNATNKLIHWYSDNASVATVSSNGLITAKGVGYAKVTATTDDGGYRYDIHVNVTASSSGGSSSNLTTNKTSYTINPTEMLEISYTTSANIPSSCAWELRQNGSYLCSAYRDTSSGKVVCYTGSLNTGTYNNITLVAKEYQTDVYVDIAVSNVFSITVSGSSSSGSGGSNSGSGGESTPPNNNSDYDARVLSLMYPMPQSHECVPNGAPSDWKYQSRWENKDKPSGWSAFGGWAQVYRVDGTPFTRNTGVEIKNYKVFGWKNGQWHSVVELPYVTGNFYAEDFTDDANSHFSNSIKPSDDRSSVIIKLTSDMTVSTSQGTKNVCYHPFTAQLDYDANFEYIFTCVSMRKVKWDENGVDDMSTSRYCASCGGDWWRQKGLTWAPDWSNNKGIAQPKITEVTTDWQVFSMTTVPEGWSHGFPA